MTARNLLRNWWVRGLLAAAILALVALVALDRAGGGNDDDPAEIVDPFPVLTLTPETGAAVDPQDQAAAEKAASDFVAAVNNRDIDALYSLQQAAYRETCDREDFAAISAPLLQSELFGPTAVEIRGNQAAANLTRQVEGGPNIPLVLPLARDLDGTWRVRAPAAGRCAP